MFALNRSDDLALPYYSQPLHEALIYHDPGRSGFFTLAWSTESGRKLAANAAGLLKSQIQPPANTPLWHIMRKDIDWESSIRPYLGRAFQQRSFPLAALETVLCDLPAHITLGTGDRFETTSVWISQGEFRKPNRQKLNLARIAVCWVDLDLRHYDSAPHLRRLTPNQALTKVLARCTEKKLPAPSLVLWTGRGLALKWPTDILPAAAYPRWAAVQKALVEVFGDLGADDAARDASRILRVAGTYNPKGDGRCEAIFVNEFFGEIERVAFDDLADAVLPITRAQLQGLRTERRAKKIQPTKIQQRLKVVKNDRGKRNQLLPFNGVRLAWAQLEDYRKLAKLRPVGSRPEGWTNTLVWLASSALAMAVWADADRFNKEFYSLTRELAPHWSVSRCAQAVASVRTRMAAMQRGEWVEFQGRKVPPIYTPRHRTVIDLLCLTPSETSELGVVITRNDKRQRDREAKGKLRRAKGVLHRDEYLNQVDIRRQKAKELRASGGTWKEVGDMLGVSSEAARKLGGRGKM